VPEIEAVAVITADFYKDVAERLATSACAQLSERGVQTVDRYTVPGAFELPLAARYAADSGRYNGVVCLGLVIRGETDHYDFVCSEAARGIQAVQLETGVPCSFGVLTVDNMEQALARSGGGKRDQGAHAAEAVVSMVELAEKIGV